MDAAATTAGWLSFMVTALGLGPLITQTSAIEERLDPYHTSRSAEHLGAWLSRQPKALWFQLKKLTSVGPIIFARLVDGFCGTYGIMNAFLLHHSSSTVFRIVLVLGNQPSKSPF